jgi:transglycosylase-like protein with SLT domain
VLLTRAIVIHYALTCGHVDPGVADAMAGLAMTESGFETSIISKPNRDGSRDFGLYQINEKNFAKLGLTRQTVLDPCEASRAAATWFSIFSTYNTGNARDGFLNGYVKRVISNEHGRSPDIIRSARPPPVTTLTLNDQYLSPR